MTAQIKTRKRFEYEHFFSVWSRQNRATFRQIHVLPLTKRQTDVGAYGLTVTDLGDTCVSGVLIFEEYSVGVTGLGVNCLCACLSSVRCCSYCLGGCLCAYLRGVQCGELLAWGLIVCVLVFRVYGVAVTALEDSCVLIFGVYSVGSYWLRGYLCACLSSVRCGSYCLGGHLRVSVFVFGNGIIKL